MDDQTRIRLGRLLAALSITAATVAVLTLAVLGRWDLLIEEFGLHNAIPAIGLGLIVWVALSTQPRNGAIWALAWVSFFGMLQVLGVAVMALYLEGDPGLAAEAVSPSEMPLGAAIAQQTVTWTWVPSVFILTTIWLLLFPDGKPLSPRWRWVGWFSATLITVSSVGLAWAARPSSTENFGGDAEVGGVIAFGLLALLLLLPTSLVSVSWFSTEKRRSRRFARFCREETACLPISLPAAGSSSRLSCRKKIDGRRPRNPCNDPSPLCFACSSVRSSKSISRSTRASKRMPIDRSFRSCSKLLPALDLALRELCWSICPSSATSAGEKSRRS